MYDKLKYVGKDSRENRGMSCITTKHWSAKIADRNSLSLPESRNFTLRRVLRTSPFAAKLAVTSAKLREAKVDPSARCMMLFAQAAEILARFLSSPVRIALYIAASALRSNKATKKNRLRKERFFFYVFLNTPLNYCLLVCPFFARAKKERKKARKEGDCEAPSLTSSTPSQGRSLTAGCEQTSIKYQKIEVFNRRFSVCDGYVSTNYIT